MNKKDLTSKDSALAFLLSFLFSQLGVVIITTISYIFFKAINQNIPSLDVVFSSAIGYLVSSLSLYLIILVIFFCYKKTRSIKSTQPVKIKKLTFYIAIAITAFLMLYPIVTCVDTLLLECGVKLSTLPYELTTKNYFISLISLVLAPAICEELLFRGVIFSGLKKHGKILSISLTALMFCLFHMSISQTVYPLLMGLLLSVIMYYENNIYYCIAVHMTNNFLSLTLSYFKVNLIFSHWTYIALAIILSIIFISTVLYLTIKKNKNSEKQPLSKTEKIYLLSSLTIMILFWIVVNFM